LLGIKQQETTLTTHLRLFPWSRKRGKIHPLLNTSSWLSWSWSSSCGRQSVDQFVWVSGLHLGPLTRFYLALLSTSDNYFILLSKASSLTRKRVCSFQCIILLSKASSLTRKRVCSLQCIHSLVRLLTPNNHTLPSHLRLCSLSVTSYDSQRCCGGILTRLHTGFQCLIS
jgi:hypothetical protein